MIGGQEKLVRIDRLQMKPNAGLRGYVQQGDQQLYRYLSPASSSSSHLYMEKTRVRVLWVFDNC